MLTDWHRMLKRNATLIIEVADFTRCLLWLFHPSREKRRVARTQFYGDQWDRIEFETHRYRRERTRTGWGSEGYRISGRCPITTLR